MSFFYGYHFSKALLAAEFAELLRSGKKLMGLSQLRRVRLRTRANWCAGAPLYKMALPKRSGIVFIRGYPCQSAAGFGL
jgi:hypothetical protein